MTTPQDSNVEAVRRKLAERAAVGLKKYGVTTERADLSTLDFLRHAQEETMDLSVYLERLIRDEIARISTPVDFHSGSIIFSKESKSAEDFANSYYTENNIQP